MGKINIDGLASFRSLTEKILTNSLRQPVFAIARKY